MDAALEPLTTYTFGRFQVLPHRGQLLADGQPIKLGGRAFDILMALLEAPGAVVDKDTLIGRVWPGRVVEEGVLWVQVSALRAAFGAERDLIRTVSGRGYQFGGEISELSARAAVDPAWMADARSSDASATNLPLPMHPIIDRERELAELEDSLQRHRLVTVVGSGGVGKTRLAIELGRRVLPHYPDGVWLVDLATLSDPSLIATTTAAALDLTAGALDLTAEVLAQRIGRRELLLIFDNCEHLIDAVAALVEALIFRAGRLTVIATSRESLRVGEEQIYALEPLSLAPAGAAEIDGFGAVKLFVERARLADRQFATTPGNAQSVAEICRRLDGVPLALEMAAARLPLLGVEGLLSGLAERLSLLKHDARRSDGRHQSLRHMVAWSYSLLDEVDQKVFSRLAIFPGSFALDSAAAIVAPLGLDRWEAVDALWRLREKSLIVVERGVAQRYRLLETLRLYAIETLRASGESGAVAEQHARHFAEVLRRADTEWETMPDPGWVALYGPEIDNLRAALDWALAESGRRQTALMFGPSLRLPYVLDLIAEGRRYGDLLVPLIGDDTPPRIAAALLYQTAGFWHDSADPRRRERSEHGVALYREIGDQLGLARSLVQLSYFRSKQSRHEEAQALLTESWDLIAPSNFNKARFLVKSALGAVANAKGDLTEALEYFTQSLQIARDLRSLNEAGVLSSVAVVEYCLGDVEQAIERGREAVVRARATPGQPHIGNALMNLTAYLLAGGKPEEARPLAEEGFSRFGDLGIRWHLQIWAVLAAFERRLTEAAQLIGFVDAERVRTGQPRARSEQRLYDELMRRLDTGLPAADLLARKAEGAHWSEAEAVDFTIRRLVNAGPARVN